MGIRGLQSQVVAIPLAAGLQQRVHKFAVEAPGLSKCINVQFDELGALQPRKPFALEGTSIFGGGTISNCRRIVPNGDEHVLFTKDKLYSWSEGLSKWIEKADYLAVATEETTTFATNGDQLDGDRAELAGVELFSWSEGGVVYVGAQDKETGAAVMSPTAVAFGSGAGSRPRLVALLTKVLLFWHNGTDSVPDDLLVLAIDPADPLSSVLSAPAAVLSSPNFGSYYDVCQLDTLDTAVLVARRVTTTSYTIATITAGLTITSSTKARSCDMAIAVAPVPGGLSVQVIRSVAGVITGDLITVAALADTASINVSIGTYFSQLNQIAVCFRSVKVATKYRCHVFWSYNEAANGTPWQTTTNFVNDDGTTGTEAVFVRRLGVASRAFDYDGRVFVWMAFAGASSWTGANKAGFRAQLQNTYFLYREADHDDPMLVAKAAAMRAGGFSPSLSHLPGVALTGGTTEYSWCATERRIIPIGANQKGYSGRAPRDVTFTFDSNEARRCARLGSTLYVTGGEVMQYDGRGLYEVGFHVYPWWFDITQGVGGSVPDGEYAFKMTTRWDNARGERERSTTATVASFTIASGPDSFVIAAAIPLYATHKLSPAPAAEIWRSAIAPTLEAPFFLVTGLDPAVTTNPNGYRANSHTIDGLASFSDVLVDADLTLRQPNPENGAVLENLSPPAATIIAASADRLFLAGIAGEPNQIWYSKLRGAGEIAAFHDGNVVTLPREAGPITALAFMYETPVAFTRTMAYALDGRGLDNVGGGQNYEPRLVSPEVGALNHEAVALEPRGLVFHSLKGKRLLDRGWMIEDAGAGVYSYDSEDVLSVHVVEKQNQVRWLTASRMLVFDYLAKQWSEWTIADGLHACIWQGTYTYLTSAGPKAEQTDYTGIDYGIDVETAWIPLGQVPGYGCVWKTLISGEYRGAHTLRVRLGRDRSDTYFQDKTWTPSPTTVGGPLQLDHGPSIVEMQAIRVRITAGAVASVYSEALKLNSLALELGLERGLKPFAAAQRQ